MGVTHAISRELAKALVEAVAGVCADLERAKGVVRTAASELAENVQALTNAIQSPSARPAAARDARGARLEDAAEALHARLSESAARIASQSRAIVERLSAATEHVDVILAHAARLDELARETRFIALNARIETQRAGQAGSTFKVVAEEVKRLAGSSAVLGRRIQGDVLGCHDALSATRRAAEGLAADDLERCVETSAALRCMAAELESAYVRTAMLAEEVGAALAHLSEALRFEAAVTGLLDGALARARSLSALVTDAADAEASGVADICAELRRLLPTGSHTVSRHAALGLR